MLATELLALVDGEDEELRPELDWDASVLVEPLLAMELLLPDVVAFLALEYCGVLPVGEGEEVSMELLDGEESALTELFPAVEEPLLLAMEDELDGDEDDQVALPAAEPLAEPETLADEFWLPDVPALA